MEKINVFILSVTLMFFGQVLFAQNTFVKYSNPRNFYLNKDTSNTKKTSPLKGLVFLASKVNEITLNTDSTFDFWCRPNVSCFTWQEYKGTWKKSKDTVLFYDNYEVVENDVRVNYKRNSEHKYHIHFFTDKKSELKNKGIKIQYVYDDGAHLEDVEKMLLINAHNVIEIPFQDIPNQTKLASIRMECMLDDGKRYGFLAENDIVNKKDGDLANIIDVEFVEIPKKEIVYRTIKALIQNNMLVILSITKTSTKIPDYHQPIVFEDSYVLDK